MTEQIRTKFLGDLGEYLLTWYLRSKFGINVSLVKAEGIDLLCLDQGGHFFPKGEHVAISVKTRERKERFFHSSVKSGMDKVVEASKRWKARPYFAYVRITPEKGLITCFLQPIPEAMTHYKSYNPKKAERDRSNILFEMKFNDF
ncbi:MAG: hypothetical protein H3Z53_03925 [archaeon]|nr:hypothetical protein [archaeon]MCP8316484.1 hypothetical protein [archaeon]MCP8321258.1 hypothetical protein [archaeon]